MNTNTNSRTTGKWGMALALGIMAASGAGLAHAGCSDPAKPAAPPPRHQATAGYLTTVVYRPAGFLTTALEDDSDSPAVVGLWKFEMISKNTATHTNPMPDGTLIDFGTVAWHSDHTELMNSGIRNPADGDFCQGAWARVGAATYVLNHYALAYSGGSYVGPTHFHERVTVAASNNTYTGQFTLTAYLATVTEGHEFDETTPLVTITGIIKATRITAD